MIRITVVDDHDHAAGSGECAFGSEDDLEVVSAGRSGREAIALAARLRPDVVLLHLEMDDVDGIETIPQLKTAQGGRLQVTGTLGTRTRVLARISIEVQA